MKKASHILLKVAGILSIVAAVGFVITGIVFFVLTIPPITDAIREEAAAKASAQVTPDEIVAAYVATMVFTGVMFIIWGALSVVNSIVSFKCSKHPTKVGHILNIVFGAISCMEVNLVGGILGLIAYRHGYNE